MKNLLALTTLAALLTACQFGNTIKLPEAPSTLDLGPHPAALGQQITIAGPSSPYAKPGKIYDNTGLTGTVYGQVTTTGQLHLNLGTPPPNSATGPIERLIPDVLPIYFPVDDCPTRAVTFSAPATYAVPSFSVPNPSSGGFIGDPPAPYASVLPALIADGKKGYVLSGRLVYVDRDVTVQGQYVCRLSNPVGTQTLNVNVTLQAGWNVLREQHIQNGPSASDAVYAITGAAADYAVTTR